LACVSCGADTKEGAILCARCFARIDDPLMLLPRALDPISDMRLLQLNSPRLRIGPLSAAEIDLDKGLDPITRLREGEEWKPDELGSLIDLNLSAMGVDLHLWGDEIMPYRESTWRLIKAAEGKEHSTESWARCSVRMGNLLALLIKEVAALPIDGKAKERFIEETKERAKGLFERADPFPGLRWAALSNQALMEHWSGESQTALSLLQFVVKKEVPEAERYRAELKRAMVLLDEGDREGASGILSSMPASMMDERLERIRDRLEERG